MYVPVPTSPVSSPASDTDHRDLLTALKLLSGEECLRDERQAHVMLVGLTESRHEEVSHDARSILKKGMERGWFAQTVPKYFELRVLAERSITAYEKPSTGTQTRQILLVIVGLFVFLLFGVVMFLRQSGVDLSEMPILAVLVAMLIIGLGVSLFVKSRTPS